MEMAATHRNRVGGWVAIASGIFLCLASTASACLTWFVLIPFLRGSGPPEFSPHLSHLGLWEQSQIPLKLGIWAHDHGFIVGDYGGGEWVEGLVASMVSGEGIGCAGGHREEALERITNHSPPEGAGLGAFWSGWWSDARGQTQAEWIRRGFEKDGIRIALPPEKDDWPALLRVLGDRVDGSATESGSSSDNEDSFRHPRRARYNAYRWLRDSGFDPLIHVLEREGRPEASERVGLLAYREFENDFRTGVPGRLDFAPSDDRGKGMPASLRPAILHPKARAILALVILGAFFAGAGLLRWGWRHRVRKIMPS